MMIIPRATEEVALASLTHLAKADRINTVAIDTETNGLDVRDGRGYLIGISIAWRDTDGPTAFYMPFRHDLDMFNFDFNKFRQALQRILDNKRVIFHNAKFDLVSLRTIGLVTASTRFFDTMLVAHLINENSPMAYDLDTVSKHYLKKPGKQDKDIVNKMAKTVGWDGVPPKYMGPYATQDALGTLELGEVLMDKVKAEKLGKVWAHKERFTRLIMRMELAGVKVDTRLAKEQIAKGQSRMLAIINELGGLVPSKRNALKKLLLDELKLPPIYKVDKRTGIQSVTFDKKAMEEYDIVLSRLDNPIARRVLEFRGWQKTLSSNYQAYLDLLSPDGRLRCNYKLHGTHTGRLSCANPNLQQIPRESDKEWNGKLKQAFIGKEGYTLVECDFSQLELRLGTAYAQEESLKTVFSEGRDVFSEMAESLGMSRQDTKTLVYSIQYGAGVNRISNVFGVSIGQARSIIEGYYTTYPGFREISNKVQAYVAKNKRAPLWSGRYRHFMYPEKQAYKAFNSVIQGGAADIVEHVMLHLDKKGYNGYTSDADCKMLLTVHDSVVFEIRDELVKELIPSIEETMADVNSATDRDFGVKFAVEAKKWGH